jgi:hypothetical protein
MSVRHERFADGKKLAFIWLFLGANTFSFAATCPPLKFDGSQWSVEGQGRILRHIQVG